MTEPELIRKMEKKRIGSDGTIPSYISKIIERGYVTVETGKDKLRKFIPTKRGIALAEGFQDIDPDLFKPTVRRYIEQQWRKVSSCKLDYEKVKDKALSLFRK